MLVVDESGSMQEQSWVAGLIDSLDDELQHRGSVKIDLPSLDMEAYNFPFVTETAPFSMLLLAQR